MDYDVIFLTAAEIPRPDNVGTSQLLEIASHLRRDGIRCLWAAVLPMQTLSKAYRRKQHVRKVRTRCQEESVEWMDITLGSKLFDQRLFVLKNVYSSIASYFLLKKLKEKGLKRRIVLNARSYFATSIAVKLASNLRASGHQVVVCFDMRGLLSLSYPASGKGDKFKLYGKVKAWEMELATHSQVIFNNRKKAVEIFRMEYDKEVTYLPVAGFSVKDATFLSFEERWKNKRVAFVGSLSEKFHDLKVLKNLFDALKASGFSPLIVTDHWPKEKEKDANFEVMRMDYTKIAAFYQTCLAIVLPGRALPEDFFQRMALNIYTAPTKMSESLTSGVPLIVGSGLKEIAEYASDKSLGLIYDIEKGEFLLPENVGIADENFWREITENAYKEVHEFSRERVVSIYRQAWEKCLPTD